MINFFNKHKIKILISVIVLLLIKPAYDGIIGNRADDLFLQLLHLFPESIYLPSWLILIFITILLMVFFYIYKQFVRTKVRNEQFNKLLEQLISLDDRLFRLITTLETRPANDQEIMNILKVVFKETIRIFADAINRTMLLRPNKDQDLQYLIPWTHLQMPQESLNSCKFYIGQERDRQRGVAGEAFITRSLRVVHIIKNGNEWRADDPNYMEFEDDRVQIPYRSFIAIPIIDADGNTLGVWCIDSNNPNAFDSHEIKDLLTKFSSRIAAILLIHSPTNPSP